MSGWTSALIPSGSRKTFETPFDYFTKRQGMWRVR
jgi:hypothetical protein